VIGDLRHRDRTAHLMRDGVAELGASPHSCQLSKAMLHSTIVSSASAALQEGPLT